MLHGVANRLLQVVDCLGVEHIQHGLLEKAARRIVYTIFMVRCVEGRCPYIEGILVEKRRRPALPPHQIRNLPR